MPYAFWHFFLSLRYCWWLILIYFWYMLTLLFLPVMFLNILRRDIDIILCYAITLFSFRFFSWHAYGYFYVIRLVFYYIYMTLPGHFECYSLYFDFRYFIIFRALYFLFDIFLMPFRIGLHQSDFLKRNLAKLAWS